VIRVDIGAPTGPEVSPDLWGLFLEDINYSFDGGLNADLVRNGDFEYGPADNPQWHAFTGWSPEGETGAVRVDATAPLTGAKRHHAVLDARSGEATLANSGWSAEGMAVTAGTTYRLRLAARSPGGPSRLHVRLRTSEGEDLAQTVVLVEGGDWAWSDHDLPVREDARVHLVLTAEPDALVHVDFVSLRPCDPSGQPHLFRPDLLAVLRELRPAFVRFPGGCVAHGLGLDNLYHWKRTVGPVHERAGMPNLWGYHQSFRIGYYELFLLCEELGATPLPVVAAGVCCQNTPGGQQAVAEADMPGYEQDVLDLVEFANGPADSPWGKVRAELGHPEPFGLRLLGLGNEDEITPRFEDRFTRLHRAVRRTHPEITVIGTSGPNPFGDDFDRGWRLARAERVAVVDEHGYRTPRWMLQNLDRYDGYDRSGPAVYLGEWAARGNSLRSALAEAAWMTGLERNSDIVRMASYAPLLARVGATQWIPDLVYFDDERVFRSYNFHVQRMFAHHRGDIVCPARVEGLPLQPQPEPSLREVWVRSPGATVTVHTGDAASEPASQAVTTGPDGERVRLVMPAGATEISLRAVRSAGDEGFVVGFGAPRTGTEHELLVGGWQNRSTCLNRVDDGIANEVDGPVPYRGVRTGEPVAVRIRVDGTRIRCWVEERLVHDHEDDVRAVPLGAVGVTAAGTSERRLTLVNCSEEPRSFSVGVDGWNGSLTARTELLTGDTPEAGAPFEAAPTGPVPGQLTGWDRLAVELPPWSLWIGSITSTD
jgi:alpha-L-arabinofuranosidase